MFAYSKQSSIRLYPPESDISIAQPQFWKKQNGNYVDRSILITLPERNEYDMLCKQNC
jgi:hypothetical protein